MSDAGEKLRALTLSVLMITSVFAGAVALSGAAAAGNTTSGSFNAPLPNGPVTDNTVASGVVGSDDVEVANISFAGPGNVTSVGVDLAGPESSGVTADQVDSVTVNLYSSGSQVASVTEQYTSTPTTVSFGSAVTGVDEIRVRATTASESFLNNGTEFDASLNVTTNPSATYNTQAVQTAFTGTNTGVVLGDVRDTENNPIANEEVFVQNVDTGEIETTTFTDSDGTYTVEVPPNANYTAFINNTAFEIFETETKFVPPGESRRVDVRVKRKQVPTTLRVIDVNPDSANAPADNQSEISFTVELLDQDGQPIGNQEILGSVSTGQDITFTSGTSQTTNADGQATFSVVSGTAQDFELLFEVGGFPNVNTSADVTAPTDEGTFGPLSGRTDVEGQVFDKGTTSGIEGVQVYAVNDAQFDQNTFGTTINASLAELNIGGDTVFVRLIDYETGEVIDVDEYRTQINESNDGTLIGTDIEFLNTSDESLGSGFALIDNDGDGELNFTHTRLVDRPYYAQVALNLSNTSREDVNENFEDTQFVNVTDALTQQTGETTAPTTDTVIYEPTQNLTYEKIEEDFAGSPADPTDITDEDGDYKLRNLFTNFQEGVNYTLIADGGAGYSTEFSDALLQENGRQFDDGDDEVFNLERRTVTPEQVNITQIGTHPPLSETGGAPDTSLITQFDTIPANVGEDTADDTFQRISRDNTVDVIQVETLDQDGNRLNGSATVEINELNGDLNGQFAVLGGTIVDPISSNEDAIEVNTGDDGVATVLYIADSSGTTVDTTKTATLSNNPVVTDSSNATFVGVINFGSASISGIVTDEDNNRVPLSISYVKTLYLGQRENGVDRFVFRPADSAPPRDTPAFGDYVTNPDSEFVVELQTFNTTTQQYEVVDSETVTIETLDNYPYDQLENDFPSVNVLPYVRNASPEGFDFYDETTEDADYTLRPLPAVSALTPSGAQAPTDYEVEAVRVNEPELDDDDIAGVDSDDGQAELFLNVSDDANLVFPFTVESANFTVSNVQPADATVDSGATVNVSATVRNEGGLQENTRTVEFRIDLDQNGVLDADEAVAGSQELTLAPGASETVEFTVSTEGVPADTYTHGVVVVGTDSSATTEITIEGSSANRFDTNENGDIELPEVLGAIDAFNNGTPVDGEPVTLPDVLGVIEAFNSSGSN